MSTPHGRLVADARRWGYDITHQGPVYRAHLLGETIASWRATDRNETIRGIHQRLAAQVGRTPNQLSHKAAAARRRTETATARETTTAQVAQLADQIARNLERDRVRRAVIKRYNELRSIERLMQPG